MVKINIILGSVWILVSFHFIVKGFLNQHIDIIIFLIRLQHLWHFPSWKEKAPPMNMCLDRKLSSEVTGMICRLTGGEMCLFVFKSRLISLRLGKVSMTSERDSASVVRSNHTSLSEPLVCLRMLGCWGIGFTGLHKAVIHSPWTAYEYIQHKAC